MQFSPFIIIAFVSELSPSHNRTSEPAGDPEATGRLYLRCSSSIIMEADVLTIKRAAESVMNSISLLAFAYLC